jgi:hypothetical protein
MNDELDILLFRKDCLERQRARLLEAIAADADEIARIDHELSVLKSQELEVCLIASEPKR